MQTEYLPSVHFDNLNDFIPPEGSTYLYGELEQRSIRSAEWRTQARNVSFVQLTNADRTSVAAEGFGNVSLRSDENISSFLTSLGASSLFIDFTGLPHHVWAPLIRTSHKLGLDIRAVYVEPKEYKYSHDPDVGEVADLSEGSEGIRPLPGFTSLVDISDDQTLFVPILGFEGGRFLYLLENVQPIDEQVLPLIGVPGFRAEYPFRSFWGNRLGLQRTRAWQRVRYAAANCPFSAFYELNRIASENEGVFIKVGMVGTKSHSLGAVLFKMVKGRSVELVYDHPRRKADRSFGEARCSIYRVSDFLNAVGQT